MVHFIYLDIYSIDSSSEESDNDSIESHDSDIDLLEVNWEVERVFGFDDLPNINVIDGSRRIGFVYDSAKYSNLFETKCIVKPAKWRNSRTVTFVIFDTNESFRACMNFSILKVNRLKAIRRDCFDFSDINFPLNPFDDETIRLFEYKNSVKINIFYQDIDSVGILRLTPFKHGRGKVVNLLYIRTSTRSGVYVYIRGIRRFLGIMYGVNLKNKPICEDCALYFTSSKEYNSHFST